MVELRALGLSSRVVAVLEGNGIEDSDAVIALNERELLALPRFGPGCLAEVKSALVELELPRFC